MTLEFTISTFFGVAGVFVYRAVTGRMDGYAVLELCARNVVIEHWLGNGPVPGRLGTPMRPMTGRRKQRIERPMLSHYNCAIW